MSSWPVQISFNRADRAGPDGKTKGRMTGMGIFPVTAEKEKWLLERMKALGIREEDLEERFVRASGSGGQKVNKTSTCVYLKHLPTGVEVKSMRERSQPLNRFFARREMVKRIEGLSGQETPRDVAIQKARRQKLKRKKRARLKYGAEPAEQRTGKDPDGVSL